LRFAPKYAGKARGARNVERNSNKYIRRLAAKAHRAALADPEHREVIKHVRVVIMRAKAVIAAQRKRVGQLESR
jgi:hypothetical protein